MCPSARTIARTTAPVRDVVVLKDAFLFVFPYFSRRVRVKRSSGIIACTADNNPRRTHHRPRVSERGRKNKAPAAVIAYRPRTRPNGMNRGGGSAARRFSRRAVFVVVAVAVASLLCNTAPAAVADTVSADVLPDGEVELRVSAGNVTAKRTSFTSPDTGYVVVVVVVLQYHIYIYI